MYLKQWYEVLNNHVCLYTHIVSDWQFHVVCLLSKKRLHFHVGHLLFCVCFFFFFFFFFLFFFFFFFFFFFLLAHVLCFSLVHVCVFVVQIMQNKKEITYFYLYSCIVHVYHMFVVLTLFERQSKNVFFSFLIFCHAHFF
jgi:hypothetical protein